MTNIAIENDHRISGFIHWKWWFSIVTLVYQRVKSISVLKFIGYTTYSRFLWLHMVNRSWAQESKPATFRLGGWGLSLPGIKNSRFGVPKKRWENMKQPCRMVCVFFIRSRLHFSLNMIEVVDWGWRNWQIKPKSIKNRPWLEGEGVVVPENTGL
jgi:hypothetical protein